MGKLELLNSVLRKLNFELNRYNKGTSGVLRCKSILERYNVDLVIDVGANTGFFGKELRALGYIGKIVSFEPLAEAYSNLERTTRNDELWRTYNFALGEESGKEFIQISKNSHSSSILEISEIHTKAESTSTYVGKQEVQVYTLDLMFNDIKEAAKEIFLKIDTQGYELNVVKGAIKSLPYINTIKLEMSLLPLYKNQPLYNEILSFLHLHGYTLIDIEPGFADVKTGQLLQFDGIFRNSKLFF